jgi:hypothetical protein
MKEFEHEGRMFETFLYVKKIPLSEVSENTNMTNGDVYDLFSLEKIPDESKDQIEKYLNRSLISIIEDEECKAEMIKQVNNPRYQYLIELRNKNNENEKSIEKIIKHLRDYLGE